MSFSMRSSPLASNPSLALSRSTTVHVQQPKRLLPQLGVLVSIWMGHSPFEALACRAEQRSASAERCSALPQA